MRRPTVRHRLATDQNTPNHPADTQLINYSAQYEHGLCHDTGAPADLFIYLSGGPALPIECPTGRLRSPTYLTL